MLGLAVITQATVMNLNSDKKFLYYQQQLKMSFTLNLAKFRSAARLAQSRSRRNPNSCFYARWDNSQRMILFLEKREKKIGHRLFLW